MNYICGYKENNNNYRVDVQGTENSLKLKCAKGEN